MRSVAGKDKSFCIFVSEEGDGIASDAVKFISEVFALTVDGVLQLIQMGGCRFFYRGLILFRVQLKTCQRNTIFDVIFLKIGYSEKIPLPTYFM